MPPTPAASLSALKTKLHLSSVALSPTDLAKLSSSSEDYSLDSSNDSTLLKPRALSPKKRNNHSPPTSPIPAAHSLSSLESSALDSSDDTVHLSLPGSFDDTLNFENIHATQIEAGTAYNQFQYNQFQGGGGGSSQKLLDRISELESTVSRERMRAQDQIMTLQSELTNSANVHNESLMKVEREIQVCQNRLSDRKSEFRDLSISDSLYTELDGLEEGNLTLKEFVCVMVYRGVGKYKNELTECRRTLGEVEGRYDALVDSSNTETRTLIRAKKNAEVRASEMEGDLGVNEGRMEELEGKVREFQRTVGDLRMKGTKYDELAVRCKSVEGKYDEIRMVAQEQAKALHVAADSEKKVLEKGIEAERETQLLRMDKSFLQQQLEVVTQRSERSEKDSLRNEEGMRDAVVKRDEVLVQLSEARHEGRKEYEDKLERELVRMREKGEVEVGDVRRNEREMWERENRVLMEGKSDFGKQVEYLQVELQELRGTHDDHILSRAKEKSELEQMVMEMRGEVKMRNFEVAKTEAGYEEAKVRVKAKELEVEHLRQQLVVHQTEFVKLKEEMKGEVERLEGTVRGKDEQLEVYLQAEITFEASIEEGRDPGAVSALSAPRRRVQHAVTLARRCVEIEKARVELTERVGELEEEKKVLGKKCGELERQVESVRQPQKYMLDGFVEKEKRIVELGTKNEELEGEVEVLRGTLEKIIKRREVVGAAVEVLNEFGGEFGGEEEEEGGKVREFAGERERAEVVEEEEEEEEEEEDLSLHISRSGGTPNKAYHSVRSVK